MFFKQIKIGPMDNFNYIIGDEETKIAALVDPAWEEDKLYEIAKNNKLKIEIILLTHTHADHTEAVARIVEKTNSKIYVHKNESDSVKHINAKIIEIQDGTNFSIGNIHVKVIFTPGHTPGSVCYLLENKLLTGDTLFVGAVGRTDLQGGNADDLFESLQKLKRLKADIEVYSGHDYGEKPHSTIEYEKKYNQYMSCKNREEFFEMRSG